MVMMWAFRASEAFARLDLEDAAKSRHAKIGTLRSGDMLNGHDRPAVRASVYSRG